MRLINCHIENFGRLSGYDRDYTEGCNSILASNGQGKSTLAAFIRVMFYGFEGEGKRKTGENERKRYEPWQGGVYWYFFGQDGLMKEGWQDINGKSYYLEPTVGANRGHMYENTVTPDGAYVDASGARN